MKAVRAFTLIELAVGLSMGAVIASAAMAVFLTVRLTALEGATRAQLARDAQLALDAIERDLAYFGAGVPLDVNGDVGSPATGQSMLPIIRMGRTDGLVFLGDLPYPNSELSGIATLSYVGAGGSEAHRFAVNSEVSGSCTPTTSGAPAQMACRTSLTTWIPGLTAAADCDDSTPPLGQTPTAAEREAARTCPWGMNKWQIGNGQIYWTFVDVLGQWHERRKDEIGDDTVDDFWGTHLEHDFPSGGDHLLGRARFFGATGGSYVTVMDRVFYAVEDSGAAGTPCAGVVGGDCSLRRRQCWGRLEDPGNATFPPAGSTAFMGSLFSPLNCANADPPDGTAWETIVSGLQDVTFRYYQDAATQLAGGGAGAAISAAQAAQVRAIEVEIRLRRRVRGALPARFLSDVVKRRYVLPNHE